jgi:hypothetical protein
VPSTSLHVRCCIYIRCRDILKDYAIEGTPATSIVTPCYYVYRSTSGKHGTFTSPRHPSYYPDKTHCIYEFLGELNEQVRITFENFRLENGYPQ